VDEDLPLDPFRERLRDLFGDDAPHLEWIYAGAETARALQQAESGLTLLMGVHALDESEAQGALYAVFLFLKLDEAEAVGDRDAFTRWLKADRDS